MTTQSIIVYRNPVEAALWEGQYAEYLVPTGAASIAALIVFFIALRFGKFIVRKVGKSPYEVEDELNWNALFWASIAWFLTIHYLWV